ncbi:MAG: coenzyme F420-0:L-glutamate ligase [Nocardioidaceae bacterium]
MIDIPEAIDLTSLSWPEIGPGADLADLLAASGALRAGDVVVLTSKVVSKAEGRMRRLDRRAAVEAEAARVLARRGDSVIAETRHGLVMAAAGVDASNTPIGSVLLLPADPDESARRVRERLLELTALNVAVVVSDTMGRAWRVGQVDMAIGCAGLRPIVELRDATDTHGNVLVVTAPAIADEIAAAADLVKGKLTGRPVAVVRGLGHWVLPPGDHGPGAVALVRDTSLDLFALGTREAALAAAFRTDPVALAHFPPRTPPDPEPFDELGSERDDVLVQVIHAPASTPEPPQIWTVDIAIRDRPAGNDPSAAWVHVGRLIERMHVVAAAYRLVAVLDRAESPPSAQPQDLRVPPPGWRRVSTATWTWGSGC